MAEKKKRPMNYTFVAGNTEELQCLMGSKDDLDGYETDSQPESGTKNPVQIFSKSGNNHDQKMELQSMDPPLRRMDGITWYTKKRWTRVGIFVMMGLLFAVGIFLAGFYSGASARRSRKRSTTESLITDGLESTTVGEVPDIEWSGVCPKKLSTCPESYQGIPPLILISLDGFRPDYLNRGFTPTLDNIAQCGTSASYMFPVFPSKTFPNHYSIVTGLYPESHGIIDNNMYDPTTGKIFKIGSPESKKAYWWEGEPIWVTAQKQGKRSYSFFWPGTDVIIKGVRPTVHRRYDKKIKFDKRVDTVLEWLDQRNNTRPDFITLYVHEPDKAGHYFGISSRQVNDALVAVDRMVARLFHGLQQRDLLDCVNLIILSDHGMADIKCNRVVELQNYVNVSEIYSTLGALGRVRPKGQKNETVEDQLIADLQCKNEHMRVYRKQELPIRVHYSNNKRIEPIFLDLDSGWSLMARNGDGYCNGGAHGYDNYFQDMKTLFMAYGPAFKFNQTVKPFANIELYEMMAELLNITANPNNGTKGSLHHLLQDPQSIPEQTEPEPPTVGTVPSDNMEFNLRVYAANCSCNKNTTSDQSDSMDVSSIHDQHLPFGVPITQELNQTYLLLYNNDYASAYDPKYRLPMWSSFSVSEKGTTEEIIPCWKGDARIPYKDTSTCSDYNTTIVLNQKIVQRPLFPQALASEFSLDEAFLVTNSVPKHEDHVTFLEQAFNKLLSSWVQLKGSLNVIAGPAFDLQATGLFPGIELIMQTHMKYGPLVMPTHYFYVVTWCDVEFVSVQDCDSTKLEVIAFLLPNVPVRYNCESASDLIKKHVARVIDVELLTGMSFFTKLPTYDAIRLRTNVPEM